MHVFDFLSSFLGHPRYPWHKSQAAAVIEKGIAATREGRPAVSEFITREEADMPILRQRLPGAAGA